MQPSGLGGGGLGVTVTPLTKKVLVTLIGAYIAQLVAMQWLHLPIAEWLFLQPIRSGLWKPWQPVTALFLNHLAPLSAAFDWLFLFFLIGPVESMLGTRRFLRAMGFSLAVGIVATELLDLVGALQATQPYVGVNPAITAMLVLFGLSMPNARILLFFVLPIRAGWVAWGSGLLTLLYFLASRDLGSTMALGGWVGAWLWLKGGVGGWRRLMARYKADKMAKDLERFTVIDGGRNSDDEWIN